MKIDMYFWRGHPRHINSYLARHSETWAGLPPHPACHSPLFHPLLPSVSLPACEDAMVCVPWRPPLTKRAMITSSRHRGGRPRVQHGAEFQGLAGAFRNWKPSSWCFIKQEQIWSQTGTKGLCWGGRWEPPSLSLLSEVLMTRVNFGRLTG